MKRYFILLLAVFAGQFSHAQFTLEGLYDQYLLEKFRNMGDYSNIDGYPYHERNFQPAEVVFKDGVVQNHELRYNNFLDEMEFKQGGKITHIANKSSLDRIVIKNKVYKIYNIGSSGPSYFVEMVVGKVGLVKKEPIEYLPEKRPKGGYEDYLPPRFIVKDPVYFLVQDGKVEELPAVRGKMLGLMDTKGFNASELSKKNKLKNNEEGLVSLINLINK